MGLLALTELVESGRLRVEIADVLPLEDAARAHRLGVLSTALSEFRLRRAKKTRSDDDPYMGVCNTPVCRCLRLV